MYMYMYRQMCTCLEVPTCMSVYFLHCPSEGGASPQLCGSAEGNLGVEGDSLPDLAACQVWFRFKGD